MKWKRLLVMAMSAMMVFTLSACGGNETGSASGASSKAPQAKEASAGQSASSKASEPQGKQGKALVAYFSCTGNTKALAETVAKALNADVYEIRPEKAYTAEDLNYNDESTRSTVEQKDDNARPALADKNANIAAYDTIVLAYPIWWGQAPRILDTFVESYDFSGKTIVPICTSGGSDIGSSADYLKGHTKGTGSWKNGKLFSRNASESEIRDWLKGLGLQ